MIKVENNERHRPDAAVQPTDVIGSAMRFVRDEAGFAQVYTINKDGYPVGRTMVAVLNEDWSVDLVQRSVHRRLGQLRRNPRVEVMWAGTPHVDSVNDRPHVYDFGLAIPRVVFVRGLAEPMSDNQLVATYQRQTAIQRGRGLTKAPERTAEEVLAELAGITIRPVQVRAEGFDVGAASFTWSPGEGPPADGGTP
jgi:hypothetical protein